MTQTTETEFSAKEVAAMNRLHKGIVDAEKKGSEADITLALNIYDLRRADGWKAIVNEETGVPFSSWTEYHKVVVPSKSAGAISKMYKIASLLGNQDASKLAKAGIERLYETIALVDKGIITMDQVVDKALALTREELRVLAQTSKTGERKDSTYPLVDFTVTAGMRDQYSGVFRVFTDALKVVKNGTMPHDWEVQDAITGTLAQLDPKFIRENLAGEGGAARNSSAWEDTPPEVVLDWIVDQYVDAGHKAEDMLELLQNAVANKVQQAKMAQEAQAIQAKADQQEADRKAKRVAANANKLIRLSEHIIVEGSDGSTYYVKDVFKDNNNAFVTFKAESASPSLSLPETGAMVPLEQLAELAVEIKKAPKVKTEAEVKADKKFSKEQSARKSKGGPKKV